jgi:hypothetical protein
MRKWLKMTAFPSYKYKNIIILIIIRRLHDSTINERSQST